MGILQKTFANFRFSLFITVISLALACVMLFAANWQWDRYKFKTELLASLKNNDTAEALEFPVAGRSPADFQPVLNKKVRLSGSYDYDHELIIMNRKHASGPGYWLLTPLKIEGSDQAVIVSRGFIPFADSTPESWAKYRFSKTESFNAVVQLTVPDRWGVVPSKSGESLGAEWHTRWLYPDIEKIAQGLPYPVMTAVFLQRLGGPPVGIFPAEDISVDVPPSTHFGYTFEWIFLAITSLVVGFLLQAIPSRKRAARQLASACILFAALTPAYVTPCQAIDDLDSVPTEAGIDEHREKQVDLTLPFTDQFGKTSPLRDFMIDKRPTVLVPVYFTCPRLCSLTQGGVAELINALELKLGQDFKVISVSFNTDDLAEAARKKAHEFQQLINDKAAANTGWSFLVGDKASVSPLMEQIGFRATPDGPEFVHAAALIILTPEGKISHYLYGIKYEPQDVQFALIEASRGKIGSTLDRILLYCFRYDAAHGKYSLAIMNVIRVVSLTVAALLTLFLLRMKLSESAS